MRYAKQLLPLSLAILVLLVGFRIGTPRFWYPDTLIDILQQISINAILAYGMTFCILIGGIDLSVGSVLALAGTTAVFIAGTPGAADWPTPAAAVGILAGLLSAVACGTFNGLCAARTRMPAFIITLASMLVARGFALRFNQGQPMHIPSSQQWFLALGNGWVGGVIPVPVLIMLVLFAAAAVLLHRTRFGQHVYAIGGNREAARFAGVPLARVEMKVYALCSLLAGVAGMVNASQLRSADPASGAGFELDAIAAAVVGGTSFTGGRGTMIGTLMGAIIIGILNKGLNFHGVHYSYQYVIKGCVILSAVYVDTLRKR